MSFLAKGRKIDLTILAKELGEKVPEDAIVIDLKEIIIKSKNYEDQFVRDMLDRIMEERLEKEKQRLENEKQRLENEKVEKERAFELEKLRIGSTNFVNGNINPVNNDQHSNTQKEFHKLMHKFNVNDGDISFYLVLFERQARRVNLEQQHWVSYLLGLLPYDLTQLIARIPEEQANDYNYVKQLLLKRLKLTPEQFRLKFMDHTKTSRSTWKDFAYELRNYLDEWISGLKINDFEALKELVISDQLKRKVPLAIREHFIDEWVQLNNSEKLAEKLDEYDSVRAGMRAQSVENKALKYIPRYKLSGNNVTYSRDANETRLTENRNVNDKPYAAEGRSTKKSGYNLPIRNEKGQPKCFSCNLYGHVSKDCQSKKLFTSKRYEAGRNCAESEHANKSNNLSVSLNKSDIALKTAAPIVYVKEAVINGNLLCSNLDTGSSSCLLKESVAKRLNLSIQPNESELFGFGNQSIPASKALGKTIVDITIDDVIGRNIPVLIVKDNTQPCDLIVGRTWLDLSYIAYVKFGNVLKLGYLHDDLFSHLGRDVDMTYRTKLKTCNAIEIEKNTVNLIKCKAEEICDGFVLFKGTGENVDSLIEIVDGKSKVPVINVGNKNITIRKDQCIGRVEVVKESDWEISGLSTLFAERENNELCVNIVQEKRPITSEEIKFEEPISSDRKQDILHLVNEYRDCFALNMKELGCTDLCQMDIKEIEGSQPVCLRPYKASAVERNTIKNIVNEWKENGIVTDTRSPYASPVLLVKKKTGEHRLVVDYRKLNNQTIKDKFPLPRIDDILECFSGCKIFTTLDLAHGYLQIPLTETAKQKTAFITPDETGQFERMIFGLANAPAEFQRLMNNVLTGLLYKKAFCYLDDIIIPASDWKDMKERLIEVLERLRAAKLTLKLSKCEFGKKEVEFLGFKITSNGITPGSRKTRAIKDFSVPRTVHEVRRFLGLTSFFRRFVKKYSQKAEPLTRLTKKDESFVWGEDQQKAFLMLKEDLTRPPVLGHYCPEAKTEVHTDASAIGIAGMLLQQGNSGKWNLIYCVSKRNTDAESKYHSSKLELMAIVWTLEKLRQYLLGIKFTVVTDCQALVYMNAKKSLNPQIARWYTLIQEFEFEVRHRPGVKMAHIDAISRSPVFEQEDMATVIEEKLEVCLTLTEEEQVMMIQNSDPESKKLIKIFQKIAEDRTADEKRAICDYIFKNNKLYRRIIDDKKEKLLFVIPKSMRKSIVVKFHDCFGHFSVDRTVKKIKELYWFPSMKRYVRRHISMCFECLMNKTPAGKQPGLLHAIKPGKRPFSIIHMDHLGPFIKSTKGNQDLLIIVDNLTRFVRLIPTKSTKAKYVLTALKDFVNDFGLPDRIITDRGSCFTANHFEEYCSANGIKHTLNSTKHPQGNGLVERVNRTVVGVITTAMEDARHKDWDAKLKEVERDLNNYVNKTSDKTPFEMLHGYSPRFNDGLLRMLADEDVENWTEPNKIQDQARRKIEENQDKMKKYYDKKKCRAIKFEVGEIVVMRRQPKSTGQPSKTQPKYRGPLTVTQVLPGDTYRVSQLEPRHKGYFYTTTAHVSQLKAWKCQPESEDEDDDDESKGIQNFDVNPRRNPVRSTRNIGEVMEHQR